MFAPNGGASCYAAVRTRSRSVIGQRPRGFGVAPQPGQLTVSVDDLRRASTRIEATADASARNVDELDAQQGVRSGEAAAFDTVGAARACAQSWQQAIQVLGAKLATAADTLNRNATAYAATENENAQRFTR